MERLTIARPYAKAIFEIAQKKDVLAVWSDFLSFLTNVVSQAEAKLFLAHPKISQQDKLQFLTQIAQEYIPQMGENLLLQLLAKRRIFLLPEINQHYQRMTQEYLQHIEVTVESAMPLDGGQTKMLIDVFSTMLNREVSLKTNINEQLLGGIRITAGDMLIDGSARYRLTRMYQAMLV